MTRFDGTTSDLMVRNISRDFFGFRVIRRDRYLSETENTAEMVLMIQCLDYHTLDDALQNYFASETKGGQTYRKRITDPPKIVIIHLIRRRY
jgi:hypothetical protein